MTEQGHHARPLRGPDHGSPVSPLRAPGCAHGCAAHLPGEKRKSDGGAATFSDLTFFFPQGGKNSARQRRRSDDGRP